MNRGKKQEATKGRKSSKGKTSSQSEEEIPKDLTPNAAKKEKKEKKEKKKQVLHSDSSETENSSDENEEQKSSESEKEDNKEKKEKDSSSDEDEKQPSDDQKDSSDEEKKEQTDDDDKQETKLDVSDAEETAPKPSPKSPSKKTPESSKTAKSDSSKTTKANGGEKEPKKTMKQQLNEKLHTKKNLKPTEIENYFLKHSSAHFNSAFSKKSLDDFVEEAVREIAWARGETSRLNEFKDELEKLKDFGADEYHIKQFQNHYSDKAKETAPHLVVANLMFLMKRPVTTPELSRVIIYVLCHEKKALTVKEATAALKNAIGFSTFNNLGFGNLEVILDAIATRHPEILKHEEGETKEESTYQALKEASARTLEDLPEFNKKKGISREREAILIHDLINSFQRCEFMDIEANTENLANEYQGFTGRPFEYNKSGDLESFLKTHKDVFQEEKKQKGTFTLVTTFPPQLVLARKVQQLAIDTQLEEIETGNLPPRTPKKRKVDEEEETKEQSPKKKKAKTTRKSVGSVKLEDIVAPEMEDLMPTDDMPPPKSPSKSKEKKETKPRKTPAKKSDKSKPIVDVDMSDVAQPAKTPSKVSESPKKAAETPKTNFFGGKSSTTKTPTSAKPTETKKTEQPKSDEKKGRKKAAEEGEPKKKRVPRSDADRERPEDVMKEFAVDISDLMP